MNLAVILASGALLLWYPGRSCFTVTSTSSTHYISGGAFLGALTLCLLDFALAGYLGYHLFRPR